ncbi:inositol monophosphatase family protein [Dactylosporangium vinaceum]|uniref:Inositol monophosphatase family protein n=1 Tax=Dactylosporangium vinaceum TaxID=53362 RepID=A0ABV5MA67_9ACTN|nr:inositol monophosphatase family protein [Dactylosporangium vinaceum]UAB93086.1 inositol monophosphatase family protein [Dactylosporangium vinaceum]
MPPTDAELAVTAAEAGAAVVRARFGADLDRVDKGGGDFTTAADMEAEAAIAAVLRAARPHDAIAGEEGGRTGPAGAERTWLVDPLCGTLNFAAGTMAVAVNVALRAGGRTVAAAVADPFAARVYCTEGPLAPSARTTLVDLNLDPPYPNAPAIRVAALLTNPAFEARFRPRVLSTTLALAWVATGDRAAYLTDGDLRDSVHFAAGIALCEAAGCVVTDLRGAPVLTGDGGLLAAADAATHAELLAMLS